MGTNETGCGAAGVEVKVGAVIVVNYRNQTEVQK
jgi:hypothetical protein